jgi:hypothetical protein
MLSATLSPLLGSLAVVGEFPDPAVQGDQLVDLDGVEVVVTVERDVKDGGQEVGA